MEGQIPGEIKNQRSDRLIEAGERVSAGFMESCRGAVRPVLFEELCEESEDDDGAEGRNCAQGRNSLITGYTDNYIKVYARGDSDDLNSIKKVKLLERYKDGMKGEIE